MSEFYFHLGCLSLLLTVGVLKHFSSALYAAGEINYDTDPLGMQLHFFLNLLTGFYQSLTRLING